MKLQEFLSLIQDEEVRIELEIDYEDKDEYVYEHFWLSDYRSDLDTAKYRDDYTVICISFMPEDRSAEITIQIKP